MDLYHADGSVLRRRRMPWQRDALAFGWLDTQHPYPRGACPATVLARLEEAARHPVDRTRGYHTCPFCPPPEATADQPWAGLGPTPHATTAGDTLLLGSASIAIEVDGERWVAPNLVLHYITAHGYLPPAPILGAPAGAG